ncbi:hypothetical protein TWF730_002702 [Orbilia blumenaviensis]|uniref:Uncharacterized protein n=1 Tax=Orbilia blumenaviensis TaxID=1796055 RepID=A0AAV9UAW7_9PEZI
MPKQGSEQKVTSKTDGEAFQYAVSGYRVIGTADATSFSVNYRRFPAKLEIMEAARVQIWAAQPLAPSGGYSYTPSPTPQGWSTASSTVVSPTDPPSPIDAPGEPNTRPRALNTMLPRYSVSSTSSASTFSKNSRSSISSSQPPPTFRGKLPTCAILLVHGRLKALDSDQQLVIIKVKSTVRTQKS